MLNQSVGRNTDTLFNIVLPMTIWSTPRLTWCFQWQSEVHLVYHGASNDNLKYTLFNMVHASNDNLKYTLFNMVHASDDNLKYTVFKMVLPMTL